MPGNVMIPLTLLNQLTDLLAYWDTSKYDLTVQLEFNDVLSQLAIKKRRLDLRDDYAKIVRAKDEEDRHDARIRYLQAKNWLFDRP